MSRWQVGKDVRPGALPLDQAGAGGPRPPSILPALTGIRAAACLWVFASHACVDYTPPPPHWLLTLCTPGYLGVDVFFILSGFILALIYLGQPASPRAALGFYIKRLFRVYPLNIVLMLAIAANAWWHHRLGGIWFDTSGFVPYLLMIESLMPTPPPVGWLATNWSVGVELLCYALFPLTARALRNTPAWLPWLLLAVMIAAEAATLRHFTNQALGPGGVARGLCGFHLGVVMAVLIRRHPMPPPALAAAGEVIAVLAGLACLLARVPWPAPLCAALLIACLAWQRGPLSRLFAARLAVWLGDISYSIYLIHGLVLGDWSIGWLRQLRAALPEPFVTLTWVGLIIAVSLAVSALTYYAIERPARHFGGQLAARLRPPRPAIAPRA